MTQNKQKIQSDGAKSAEKTISITKTMSDDTVSMLKDVMTENQISPKPNLLQKLQQMPLDNETENPSSI